MLSVNPGIQGAKRTRLYRTSPDALLRRLVDKHPDATEAELGELFAEKALDIGGELMGAIIAYFFANRYRAFVRETMPIEILREKKAKKDIRIKEHAEIIKKATVAKICRDILSSIAPLCGKKIGDMTRKDCEREGGWFLTIASKLRGRRTISQLKLTDEELYNIYLKK